MAYPKVGPWVNGGAPALSAANLDRIETQYELIEAILTARGDIFYRNATVLARLAKGTDGQFLRIGANDPIWTDIVKLVNTEVFSGNSPNPSAWTDLDLSAVVGARAALVMLRFYNANAGQSYVVTRPNGETEASETSSGTEPFHSYPKATEFTLLIALTDAAGVIEWKYQRANEANTTIDVIGYIN